VLVGGDGKGVEDRIAAAVSKYTESIAPVVSSVRWKSWDSIVTIGRPYYLNNLPDSREVRVVQIGGSPLGRFRGSTGGSSGISPDSSGPDSYNGLRPVFRPGHELLIPQGLSEERTNLVKRHIIPLLPLYPDVRTVLYRPGSAEDVEWQPLLENADGQAIAVIYRPHRGAREVWYFPEEADQALDAILRVAFTEWNAQDPNRFPSSPSWTSDARWMSAEQQQRVLALRNEIDSAREQIDHLASAIREFEVKLDVLSGDVEQSPQRKLLMATGDDLVEAVAYALKAFEFDVVDLDALVSEGVAKTADLLVSEDDWSAIVEVKGYAKGAKSNDLMDVMKHRRAYERRHGCDAGSMWYVANIFRTQSPESRPEIFAGADDQLDSFAEPDGLVIDTRELFDLLKQVESGAVSPAAARAVLKNSTGRFSCHTELLQGDLIPDAAPRVVSEL